MTAALKLRPAETEAYPALLGVERSARGFRWAERLDPSRAHIAASIAQAHGLPELLGRVLAARGADPQTVSRFLDPSLKTLLPDPARLQDMEKAAESLCRRHQGRRADRRVRRLRRRRRGFGRAGRALPARAWANARDLYSRSR